MILDIKPIILGEKTSINFDAAIECDEKERFSELFPDITFEYPIAVCGKVRNMSGYMTLDVEADVHFSSPCARCAEMTGSSLHLSPRKNIASGDVSDENDDYIFPEDMKLDISTVIIEELLLEMPSKILCREDCRGLCPRCGKNLNEGSCDCKEPEGDPRLAILKTLLK